MATTNARIQFSTDSIDTWTTINPTLREGEPVLAKTNDGKYALYAGNIGGSLFTESVLIWDETKAEGIIASAQAAADEAGTYCDTCKQSATEAAKSATEAATSATNASASATEAAKQATAAKASATAAATSATNAATSAEEAAISASDAKADADEADASKTAAAASEANAKIYAANAATSESNAKASEEKAKTSETKASTSEANAKASETAAATSEANAKASETNAKASEEAAKTSETNAATSETNAAASAKEASTYLDTVKASEDAAKTSEINAATSAEAAKKSETNSATSEENAAKSAAESVQKAAEAAESAELAKTRADSIKGDVEKAAASASAAANSATEAATSATNAANSETAAKTSEENAANSATEASTYLATVKANAEAAATSEANAKASEKAAGKSEANAATSATNAATAETNATASATAAATSATNAGESETAAKAAEVNAAASAKKAEEAAKLTNVLKYKGSVATYAELPTENEIGDVWNVQKADKTHSVKAGDNVAWSGTEWDNLGGTCDMSEYTKTEDLAKVATSGSYNDLTDKPEIGGDADNLLFGASYTSKIAKISTWPTGLGNVAIYFPNVTDIASDAFYRGGSWDAFMQEIHFSVANKKTIKALENYPKFGGNTEPTIIFDIDAVTMTIERGNATVVGVDGEEIAGTTTYIIKSTDTPVFASDGVGLLTATVNEAEDFTYTVADIPSSGNRVGINITDAGSATVTADYKYSGIYIAGLNGATTGVYCAENTPLDVLANIVTDTAFLQYSGTVTAMTDITLADCTSVPDYIKMTTGVYVVIDPAALAVGSAYSNNQNINIVHSENAETIGSNAFYNYRQLTTAELPAATSIGSSAFYGCTGLTTLELPAATSIGNMAFQNCTGLTTLELPAATSIGSSAFSDCTGLTTLELPAATSIGSSAFNGWGTKEGVPDGVARTVHFAAANEETIKALSGYSNSFGYEGTLTMLFDL